MRKRALWFVSLSAALALMSCSGTPPEVRRDPVHVVTGLPLFWGEGGIADVLNGTAKKSALIDGLEGDGPVSAVVHLDATVLAQTKLLLMIQPPALIPEELVALDAWVRGGGHVVILADPDLAWESTLMPGDPRRAPVQSLLGPLFSHWGLTLVPDPPGDDPVDASIGGASVKMMRPGQWKRSGDGACVIQNSARLANCSLDKGRAIIVADADFANPDSEGDSLGALRGLLRDVVK
jgi:hypothetical protein